MLEYCPDLGARLERLRRLWEARDPEIALAVMQTPNAALAEFARTHPGGPCERPELAERLAFWDAYYRERREVRDDSVPAVYLTEMDQGLYGGVVGGRTQFMCDPNTGWISSMVEPILAGLDEFDGLRFDEDGPWYRFYLEELRVLVEGARGRFGVSHFIVLDSLNYAFELIGATDTYLALTEDPDTVRRVIDFAFELNARVQDDFFERVDLIEGGVCSNMTQWMPGRLVSESLDPFHMTSVDTFEEWGREPAERIFARYDGGVIHIHGNGRHLLRAASTLAGLKGIGLGDDLGFPPTFDVLHEIKAQTGDMPLVLAAPFERFREALDTGRLAGGVLYQVTDVPDVREANALMDRVRACRP